MVPREAPCSNVFAILRTATHNLLADIKICVYVAITKAEKSGSMEHLLAALRAVAEPTRLRLVVLCARGELTVSELTQILGQSQPRVSRH